MLWRVDDSPEIKNSFYGGVMRTGIVLLTPFITLIVLADPLSAQMNPDLWLLQDAHIPSNEMVLSFSPVSESVCWAATIDTNNTPPSGYIRKLRHWTLTQRTQRLQSLHRPTQKGFTRLRMGEAHGGN
jgi:hypothetical protein